MKFKMEDKKQKSIEELLPELPKINAPTLKEVIESNPEEYERHKAYMRLLLAWHEYSNHSPMKFY